MRKNYVAVVLNRALACVKKVLFFREKHLELQGAMKQERVFWMPSKNMHFNVLSPGYFTHSQEESIHCGKEEETKILHVDKK